MKNDKIPFKCGHSKTEIISEDDLKYCITCGVIIYKSKKAMKSTCEKIDLDYGPTIIFDQLKSMNKRILLEGQRMKNQVYFLKRTVLISQLKKCVIKYNLSSKVCSLAIVLIDNLLTNNIELNISLTSVVCLIIAAKFEEHDLPFIDLSTLEIPHNLDGYGHYFTLKEIKIHEIRLLHLLKHKLNYSTPRNFLDMFLTYGIIFENELTEEMILLEEKYQKHVCNNTKPNEKNKTYRRALKLMGEDYKPLFTKSKSTFTKKSFIYNKYKSFLGSCENSCTKILYTIVEDIRSLNFSPLDIAVAAIAICRLRYSLKEWPEALEKVYMISFNDFRPCYDLFKLRFVETSSNSLSYFNYGDPKLVVPLKTFNKQDDANKNTRSHCKSTSNFHKRTFSIGEQKISTDKKLISTSTASGFFKTAPIDVKFIDPAKREEIEQTNCNASPQVELPAIKNVVQVNQKNANSNLQNFYSNQESQIESMNITMLKKTGENFLKKTGENFSVMSKNSKYGKNSFLIDTSEFIKKEEMTKLFPNDNEKKKKETYLMKSYKQIPYNQSFIIEDKNVKNSILLYKSTKHMKKIAPIIPRLLGSQNSQKVIAHHE